MQTVPILKNVGVGALVTLTSAQEIAELNLGGGSGYGPPQQRSRQALQQDLEDGYITATGAQRGLCLRCGMRMSPVDSVQSSSENAPEILASK